MKKKLVFFNNILYSFFKVKVVVSDDDAHVMNSWSHEQQCVPQVRITSNYIYKLSPLVSEVQNLVGK